MPSVEIAVTGLGFISSIGNNEKAVKESLLHLRHGIQSYRFTNVEQSPVSVLGTVKGFNTESLDPEDWTYPDDYSIPRTILRGLSPHGLYAHCAMEQAIASSHLSPEEISNARTGLYSSSVGSTRMIFQYLDRMHKVGVERTNPKGVVASVAGTLNFNLGSFFKIQGSSCGFTSACASSGHALGFAFDEIQAGRQDRIFVVGAEDGNPDCILPFAGMRALSVNTDPDTASRPFDQDRDGFVGTGGATVLVLENREVAEKRGAPVYGYFRGWGQSSDGYNPVLPEPEGAGLIRAMQFASERSGLAPEQVDYVNAHAPSTPFGDAAEMKALKSFFGVEQGPGISSTKALHGHGLSLASALEAGVCLLALKHGFSPGSAHIQNLDPESEGLNILRKTESNHPKIALSNSSGFGGANVSLVFEAV